MRAIYQARIIPCIVIRLKLGRGSVDFLPVAQRTTDLTNGIVGRTNLVQGAIITVYHRLLWYRRSRTEQSLSAFLGGFFGRRPDAVALPVEQGAEIVGDGVDVLFRHLVARRDPQKSA